MAEPLEIDGVEVVKATSGVGVVITPARPNEWEFSQHCCQCGLGHRVALVRQGETMLADFRRIDSKETLLDRIEATHLATIDARNSEIARLTAELGGARAGSNARQKALEAFSAIPGMLSELLGDINARVMGSEGETPEDAALRMNGEIQSSVEGLLGEIAQLRQERDAALAELAEMRDRSAAALELLQVLSGRIFFECPQLTAAAAFLANPANAAAVAEVAALRAEHEAAAHWLKCLDAMGESHDLPPARRWNAAVAAVEAARGQR